MSFQYTILKTLVRIIGFRKKFASSPEEIIARLKIKNAKNTIPALKDDEIDVTQMTICDCPVLKMVHKTKSKRANLFIIGGGMVAAPRPGAIKKALNVAKETGLDIFVPYYPLCTEYPVTAAYNMILETYKKMLNEYEPQNISLLGSSSGGNLALGLVAHLNTLRSNLPKPGNIILLSPGTCPATDEEWKRMQELDKLDILIPAQYMKKAETIMRHGAEVPDYMIYLQKGDFTGCPETTFIYGSDETLYACAPSFEEAMKKYHVKYEMIVGKGMFHCYPVFPVCPEAKQGWNKLLKLLRG